MNDTDAIFFLEAMKMSMLGAMQENCKNMNKYAAAAANSFTIKNIQAIEIGIKAIKERK